MSKITERSSDAHIFPYEVVSGFYGDARRRFARYRCKTCDATKDFMLTSGDTRTVSPDFHNKVLAREGWTGPQRRGTLVCPDCSRQHGKRIDIAEIREEIAMALDIRPNSSQPAVSPAQQALREPTTADKLKIRSELDAHFDDAAGMYLGTMSDQAIGEKLKMPWKWIEQLREAAYGPIRVTAEMVAVRNDMVTLATDINKLTDRYKELAVRVGRMNI